MNLPYVDPSTYLFRFMNHRAAHFWDAILDVLGEQKLFLNSRTKFNDPYDSQPKIVDDVSTSAIRDRAARMFSSPARPWRDDLDVARILDLQAQGKTHLNK